MRRAPAILSSLLALTPLACVDEPPAGEGAEAGASETESEGDGDGDPGDGDGDGDPGDGDGDGDGDPGDGDGDPGDGDGDANCPYPEHAEPMALDQPIAPYAWPLAIHGDGTMASLDLDDAHCDTDEVIDWSPHDILVFISIPAW